MALAQNRKQISALTSNNSFLVHNQEQREHDQAQIRADTRQTQWMNCETEEGERTRLQWLLAGSNIFALDKARALG